MKIELPKQVAYIINMLEKEGYEGYAVGGCVRDTILGRKPQDWDITTSAKPMQIKKIFSKTIDTGIQHGTVTVMIDHIGYEVTTYRIDGEYEDSRHPKCVEFTDNLKLDLERRDFTINAMAYNDKRGIVDEFHGIEDLQKHVIRCVGNPGERFDEDALRMLRAVRFSGQLGFIIEENTRQAIINRASHLDKISAERIRVEMTKLLISKDAGEIREAYHTGMTKVFLPELDKMMEIEQKNPHHIFTIGEHSIHSVEVMNYFFGKVSGRWDVSQIPKDIVEIASSYAEKYNQKQHIMLCVTMLLHDIGKTETMTIDENGVGHFYGHPEMSQKISREILKRLTFDNETISIVKPLIYWHDYQFGINVKEMRRAVAKVGKDIMPMLFLVQFSDILAQNPDTFEKKLQRVCHAIKLWDEIIDSEAALELKDLKITGKDLIAMGVKPGPKIGEILKMLLDQVIENPEWNEKEKLLAIAKKNID